MEFEYDPNTLNSGKFMLITEHDVRIFNNSNSYDPRRKYYLKLEKVIDGLGELSAEEQFLKKPITTFRHLADTNHKLYLAVDPFANNGTGALTGYIKIGQKKLFLTDGDNEQVAVDIQCVLDFYVHRSHQRRGWGYAIFDYMLQRENLTPYMMAFDRPSPKLTTFLEKHYGLTNAIWQPNRYTVFKEFFQSLPVNNNNNEHHFPYGYTHIRGIGTCVPKSYAADLNSPTSTKKRLDSISKIIQQVPPSP